ncbi:MAG: hypothetical protein ABIP39_12950 [Polyangiaceae bacterium]
MVRAAGDENEISEATLGVVATGELEYSATEIDSDEARRPAGEAGLFGDPRPDDVILDDQDGEPELVRS